jgi:uncharacterized protein (TIGR02996 family)
MTARPKRVAPDPLPIEPWLRQFPGVEGFLRAIAEEPWDDAHRLILADWLDERGATERAEVIRAGAVALVESESRTRCNVSADDLKRMAACPRLARLRELSLSGNNLGDAVKVLATSPHVANLTHLTLADNSIGTPGIVALARSPRLANLTSLHLAANVLSNKAAEALIDSPHLTRLTRLAVNNKKLNITTQTRLTERWPFVSTVW